jgi:hypothetical protein
MTSRLLAGYRLTSRISACQAAVLRLPARVTRNPCYPPCWSRPTSFTFTRESLAVRCRGFHTRSTGIKYSSASTRSTKNLAEEEAVKATRIRWPELKRLISLARPEVKMLSGKLKYDTRVWLSNYSII